MPFCLSALNTIRRSSEKRLGMAIVLPTRSRTEWIGPSLRTTKALPYRWPRYTIWIGTPCAFSAIAMGATMNPTCMRLEIERLLDLGEPLEHLGG